MSGNRDLAAGDVVWVHGEHRDGAVVAIQTATKTIWPSGAYQPDANPIQQQTPH